MSEIKLNDKMQRYELVEILADHESFQHSDCEMGFILDQGIFIKRGSYEYFYPWDKVIRMVLKSYEDNKR